VAEAVTRRVLASLAIVVVTGIAVADRVLRRAPALPDFY
jgi:hypothetical protein